MACFYESLVINLQSVSPSEFWQLTPNEAGLILDWHYEQQLKTGTLKKESSILTDEQYERLENKRAELRAKGFDVL